MYNYYSQPSLCGHNSTANCVGLLFPYSSVYQVTSMGKAIPIMVQFHPRTLYSHETHSLSWQFTYIRFCQAVATHLSHVFGKATYLTHTLACNPVILHDSCQPDTYCSSHKCNESHKLYRSPHTLKYKYVLGFYVHVIQLTFGIAVKGSLWYCG